MDLCRCSHAEKGNHCIQKGFYTLKEIYIPQPLWKPPTWQWVSHGHSLTLGIASLLNKCIKRAYNLKLTFQTCPVSFMQPTGTYWNKEKVRMCSAFHCTTVTS